MTWRLSALLFLAAGLGLASCAENDAPDDVTNPVRASDVSRIVPAEEALVGAHVPTIDPATLNDAEIAKVLGAVPHCDFRYTSSGKPVLAVTNAPSADAVVKLNGSLIALHLASDESAGSQGTLVLTAGQVRASLTPLTADQLNGRISERQEMTLMFEIDNRLKVGYRGYFNCSATAGSEHVQATSVVD